MVPIATEPQLTTLIVGAGTFGISTAYHLAHTHPCPSQITILDRAYFPAHPASDPTHHELGASADINKIVRADYTSPFYMSLGYEAIDAWSTWHILKPFYHRTGWVALDEGGSDNAKRIRKNFRESGREDVTKDMSFDEVKEAWGGALKDTDFDGFESAYWNPEAGWVEADKAVAAMLKAALDKGVKYVRGEAMEVILGTEGVKGVKLEDGRSVMAHRTLLATGAWTSRLLSRTEDRLNLEEGQRIEQQLKTAGVCVAHFALSAEEKKTYDKVPIVIYGSIGEMLPPPPSKLLKFTNDRSFTNTVITPSGHQISVPLSQPQDIIPTALKEETLSTIKRIMPPILDGHRSVSFWRMCWDSLTPSQHQLITKHPNERLANLFIAAGGSFHSWKFLPTIGKYVSNVLEGSGNGEEKDRNWAWKEDRWDSESRERGVHEKVIPKKEIRAWRTPDTKSRL